MTASTLSEQPPTPGKPGRLTFAQQLRRNTGLQQHRQRQVHYPLDPTDPKGKRRIRRESPQRQARLLAVPRDTATPVHHTAVEHPQDHPNQFLYLYLLNPDNTGGARSFVWMRHAPDPDTGKGFHPLARQHTSVYEAIVHMYNAGFLDASW